MYRVAFVASALLILTVQAQARPHTYLHHIQYFRQAMAMAPGDERIVSWAQHSRPILDSAGRSRCGARG